jgi:hypothetical protein
MLMLVMILFKHILLEVLAKTGDKNSKCKCYSNSHVIHSYILMAVSIQNVKNDLSYQANAQQSRNYNIVKAFLILLWVSLSLFKNISNAVNNAISFSSVSFGGNLQINAPLV